MCECECVQAGASPVLECLSSWTNADGIMFVLATNTRPQTCQVFEYGVTSTCIYLPEYSNIYRFTFTKTV